MRLELLRSDIAGARRAATFLAALLVVSLLTNVVLALLSVRLSGRERVVLVPPTINKTFWVDAERVSAEYLQQMAYFLVQLTLNVTPQSVDHQASVLLQYAGGRVFLKAFRETNPNDPLQTQSLPATTTAAAAGAPADVR